MSSSSAATPQRSHRRIAAAIRLGVDPADPRILTDPNILPASIRESLIGNQTHSPAEPNA